MKKITTILLLILLLSSCDSLWQVGETSDITFRLNLAEMLSSQSTRTDVPQTSKYVVGNMSKAVIPELDNDPTNIFVIVSLHRAKDKSVIASASLSLDEAQNTDVVFTGVAIKQTVYAEVQILSTTQLPDLIVDPLYFRARSFDTELQVGINKLVAYPNALFYINTVVGGTSINLTQSGNEIDDISDDNFLADAYEYLRVDGKLIPDATIYLKSPIEITDSNVIWNYPGLTLKRCDNNVDTMVDITGKLTIEDITIDGNARVLGEVSGSAVTLRYDANPFPGLTLKGGTITDNVSRADDQGGGITLLYGDFSMQGGSIIGNKAPNGGGIYDNNNLKGKMTGGTIAYNTAEDNGGGIFLAGGQGVEVSGGVIQYNTANKGGGISFSDSETSGLSLYGGTISNNKAIDSAGGVNYIRSGIQNAGESAISIKNNPIVRGNTAGNRESNVYIVNTSPPTNISVYSGLTCPDASIGISMETTGEFAYTHSQGPPSAFEIADIKKFFSDEEGLNFVISGANNNFLELQ